MKKIEAIIQPFKLDDKVKIEVALPSGRIDEVVSALTGATRTCKIGGGKGFVSDVAGAIRIRNDDRGQAAL